MLPTWMYAKVADDVYVNLFVGSTVKLDNVRGADVEMVQRTNYPWDGKVEITVSPTATKQFAVRVRVPNRTVSELYTSTLAANGIARISVNGSAVKPKIEQGYAVIDRTWTAGDRIELELPMTVQRVRAAEVIDADRGKVALQYGPLVYNIEQVDQDITKTLAPDAPLTTEWRSDLLGGMMVIRGAFTDGTPMMAIPHYARMNREPTPAPVVAPVVAPPTTNGAPAPRPAPRPPVSVVWINEARA